AAAGERAHLVHDRREARHRPGAQIVAVRKSSREDDDVGALQIVVLVPEVFRFLPEDVLRGMKRILVAVAARKDDDPETHVGSLPPHGAVPAEAGGTMPFIRRYTTS